MGYQIFRRVFGWTRLLSGIGSSICVHCIRQLTLDGWIRQLTVDV